MIKRRTPDLDIALFYIDHIISPCTDDKTGLNLRSYHIREAKKAMENFENPYAKALLEWVIKGY